MRLSMMGLVLVLAGAAAFDYTKPETVQAHTEWATDNQLPEPDDQVFWAGAGAATLGAFLLGVGVARPNGKKSS